MSKPQATELSKHQVVVIYQLKETKQILNEGVLICLLAKMRGDLSDTYTKYSSEKLLRLIHLEIGKCTSVEKLDEILYFLEAFDKAETLLSEQRLEIEEQQRKIEEQNSFIDECMKVNWAGKERVPDVHPFTAFLENIPYDVTAREISEWLDNKGIVEVRLMMGENAYVNFENKESLETALAKNGEEMMGCRIRVTEHQSVFSANEQGPVLGKKRRKVNKKEESQQKDGKSTRKEEMEEGNVVGNVVAQAEQILYENGCFKTKKYCMNIFKTGRTRFQKTSKSVDVWTVETQNQVVWINRISDKEDNRQFVVFSKGCGLPRHEFLYWFKVFCGCSPKGKRSGPDFFKLRGCKTNEWNNIGTLEFGEFIVYGKEEIKKEKSMSSKADKALKLEKTVGKCKTFPTKSFVLVLTFNGQRRHAIQVNISNDDS